MKIDDFVAAFKANSDKVACLKEHVTTKYVPFLTKVAQCKAIVQATMEIQEQKDGKVLFLQRTPMRYLIFSMTLIKFYTDIEYDEGEDNSKFAEEYDKLAAIGAIDLIPVALPAGEVKEFDTILKMVVDDYFENNRSVASILGSSLDLLKK